MEYNAEAAAAAANSLKALMGVDMGRSWAPGTGNDAYPDKTRSLPNIWTTYPEIAEYGKAYAKAVNDLAANAGNGLDALRENVGPLGKSCKGCHDEFRAERK